MRTEILPTLLLFTRAPQLVALEASETFTQAHIPHALARHAARGERVGVILGSNRLDVRSIARWARQRRLDPRPLLARVDVSRAETCHQLAERIATLSPEQERAWRALCIVGFLETFYDETPAYHEARWLLHQTLAHLTTLAANGLPVLITVSAPHVAARAVFLQDVARRADVYWHAPEPLPRMDAPRQLALTGEN
jgi:hypothetical protein